MEGTEPSTEEENFTIQQNTIDVDTLSKRLFDTLNSNWIIKSRKIKKIRELLSSGAETNRLFERKFHKFPIERVSPLHVAISKNDFTAVKVLMEEGHADVNLVSNDILKANPLEYAILLRKMNVVSTLEKIIIYLQLKGGKVDPKRVEFITGKM